MFRSKTLFDASKKIVKRSTGITGLEVVPNWHEVLTTLYTRTLEDTKTLPEGGYRSTVEGVTKYRLGVLNKETCVMKVEGEINCGQVEELIQEAKDEIHLIEYLKERNFFS